MLGATNLEVQYRLATPQRPRTSSTIRRRRLLVIVAVVALYIPSLWLSISMIVSGQHYWGLHGQFVGNTWQVRWDGTSAISPLSPGDTVLTVDGLPPRDEAQINRANDLFVRSPGDKVPHIIRWQAPGPLDMLVFVGWMVMGAVALVLSVLVFLHATDRPAARRFLLLWGTLGLFGAIDPAALLGSEPAYVVGNITSALVLMALPNLLWFLLRAHPAVRRWVPDLLFALAVLWDAILLIAIAGELQSLNDLVNNSITIGLFASVALLSSIWLLLRGCFARNNSLIRERARTLVGGTLLGIFPFLALTIAPLLVFGQPFVPGATSALALLIIPFFFAYAILRKGLLHLDVLIRRSVFGLLLVVATGVLVVALAALFDSLPGPLGIGLSAGISMVLLFPLSIAARWLTETWLFPQVRRYRQLVAQGAAADAHPNDPGALADQLTSAVRLQLPVHHARLYVFDKSGDFLALGGETEPLRVDKAVYTGLMDKRAVLVEPSLPDLSQTRWPTGPLPRLPAGGGNTSSGEILDWAWQALVPLGAHRLVGILAVGPRDDNLPFSSTDLDVLGVLARGREHALENALQYDALRLAYEQQLDLSHVQEQIWSGAERQIAQPLAQLKEHVSRLHQNLGSTHGEGERNGPALNDLWKVLGAFEQGLEDLREQLTQQVPAPDLERRSVDLDDVFRQSVRHGASRARERHITLSSRIAPGLTVLGDARAIRQVVDRLLFNAVEASHPSGTVHFQVHRRGISLQQFAPLLGQSSQGRGGRQSLYGEAVGDLPLQGPTIEVVEVVVSDQGSAIPKQVQPFLFDVYSPEHPPERPGLPVVAELVWKMGGGLWYTEDELARTCSFHIVLPLLSAEPPQEGVLAPPFNGIYPSLEDPGEES